MLVGSRPCEGTYVKYYDTNPFRMYVSIVLIMHSGEKQKKEKKKKTLYNYPKFPFEYMAR